MWGQDIKLRKELKTYWIEWKWIFNIPKLMGYNEGGSERQEINDYLKFLSDVILVI